MKRKVFEFANPYSVSLVEQEIPEVPGEHEVYIRTAHTTISSGSEKANYLGDNNVTPNPDIIPTWPRYCGYAVSGTVMAIGEKVTNVKVGDRVILGTGGGIHANINCVPDHKVVKVPDNVSLSEASMTFISVFPLSAIRKTRLEPGDSALVMGLGNLGCFAIQQLRHFGAYPVIAADPVKERREFALSLGADYAFDPFEPDFAKKVKAVTPGCKGVNVAIEVTGVGSALDTTLDCMAKMGRVALLGCTRDKNFTIDYYRKVHGNGVQLIGAHIGATPELESAYGFKTQCDESRIILNLLAGGRISFKQFVTVHDNPHNCAEVYKRLVEDKNFPIGYQFDWEGIE